MDEQKEIDIKINPDGTVDIDLIGYHGQGCDIDMKKIQKQIGIVVSNKKKCEYYDETKVKIQQTE
jgi:hypothetical protein